MAKAKKSKKFNADSVHAKKSAAAQKPNPFARPGVTFNKKMNPFEIHMNREKFQILGRTCKHDRGLPGVSRLKAIKKRKETLGQEFREKHKSNQFKDKRIGKNFSGAELDEDLLNARFVADKMFQLRKNKMSRFNLNDDEILTHRGQTLEEIEQFRDERSDDDDDVEDETLDANFTESAHFGGDDTQQKDRKTAIDEMIVEQKRRKAEVAKEKDEVFNMTEKLDCNYKNLVGLMGKMKKSELKSKPAQDDYDKIMREMVFEPRGVVTDKLLTEEQAAEKEKQRLEELERARLLRMRGDDADDADEQLKLKHRSADDLDDGYFADGIEEEEESTLAYNMDGELDTKLNGDSGNRELISNGVNNSHEDEDEGDNVSENESSENEQSENSEEEDEEGEESEEEEEDEEGESEDNLSDLKESDSESASDSEDKMKIETKQKSTEKKTKLASSSSQADTRSDLPFTIEMPTSYEDFADLIKKHTPEDQATLIERLIKCNHPKLDGVNREKVVHLFAYLLKYIDELFVDASIEDVALHFRTLSTLTPFMYDLIHLNSERMSQNLLDVIKAKYGSFRKNSKSYPQLETFVLLKLVSNLFTTSDFRHPIVTPCFIFAQHILSRTPVRTRQDISMGLFLVNILVEYTQQSRRFVPAAWNFLLGIIYLAIPKRAVEVLKIVPPFYSTGPFCKLLAITEYPKNIENTEELMTSEDLVTTTLTTDFKVRALNTALKLINDNTSSGFSENVGANYLASPLLEMLERLSIENYPEYVRNNYEQTLTTLKDVANKPLVKLVPPERKPKALRLLEPRIETVYDDKRRPKMTKEKEERAKLMHKIKRETKGAVREIRRDTEFLQKMRLQQTLRSDMERKEKVKRIFQEASVQQGELNELARAKKKKKF